MLLMFPPHDLVVGNPRYIQILHSSSRARVGTCTMGTRFPYITAPVQFYVCSVDPACLEIFAKTLGSALLSMPASLYFWRRLTCVSSIQLFPLSPGFMVFLACSPPTPPIKNSRYSQIPSSLSQEILRVCTSSICLSNDIVPVKFSPGFTDPARWVSAPKPSIVDYHRCWGPYPSGAI